MTLDRSYIGYLGFLGIDLFESVLMYSNGAICLIKLLFKMGLFTVYANSNATVPHVNNVKKIIIVLKQTTPERGIPKGRG
jgi:hypothetical protein